MRDNEKARKERLRWRKREKLYREGKEKGTAGEKDRLCK